MFSSPLDCSGREVDIGQILKLSAILVCPNERFRKFLSFSFASRIMFEFHMKVQWAFGAIEFVALRVRTFVWLFDLVSTTSEVLLPTAVVSLDIVIAVFLLEPRWCSTTRRLDALLLFVLAVLVALLLTFLVLLFLVVLLLSLLL